jgi:predicted esterase
LFGAQSRKELHAAVDVSYPCAMSIARSVAAGILLCSAACSSKGIPSAATADAGLSGPATTPPAQFVPKASGTCPAFTEGSNTFSPDGKSRDVLLWVGDQAKTLDGPLVFFWHGSGGDPSEATQVLGPALDAILAMGGVVAAPYHDPAAGSLPWYLSTGGTDESDLRVADEVLACALATVGIDRRHIHSIGFSAGAMHNTQFAALRSGYLASIVDYSGARLSDPDEQDAANKYPAMLFYGGASDQVGISFADEARNYHTALTSEGHFSFLCNHDMGHTVPFDGRAAAWQFLQDHPFGVTPEPYAKALPAGFPSYCAL